MDYIKKDSLHDPANTLVSAREIAILLLGWSLKAILTAVGLMESSTWETFSVCLSYLHERMADASVADSLNHQILTQSNLFKLCPKILLLATNEGTVLNEPDLNFAVESYQTIVGHYFRPTIDVAFRCLLLPYVEKGNWDRRFLVSTLNHLKLLHMSGKGNHKTTFSLVASRPILLALSKAHYILSSHDDGNSEIVTEFLTDTLFTNHMDGFYVILRNSEITSIRPEDSFEAAAQDPSGNQAVFRYYQEELLKVVEDTLVNDVNIEGLRVVPLLLQCFLIRSKLENKSNSRTEAHKARRKLKDDNIPRFHLFSRWAGRLFLILTSESTQSTTVYTTALQSLIRLLQLLADHDVYTHSKGDASDSSQFGFLKRLTDRMVRLVPSVEVIPAFTVLLSLDHLVFQDALPQAIMLCLHTSDNASAEFLTKYYQVNMLLRQQQNSIEMTLEVSNSIGGSNEASNLLRLLVNKNVSAMMSSSFRHCPVLQTNQIFISFEAWLSKADRISLTTQRVLSILVASFCSNMRIDRTTASDISPLCKSFVERSICPLSSLFHKGSVPSSLAGLAMHVCGSILDLDSRCSFWLGRHTQLESPERLLEFLEGTSNHRLESWIEEICIDGLLVMGCQRLRQLHSLILDRQRADLESLASHDDKNSLFKIKVSRLAALVAVAARTQRKIPGIELDTRWSIVAENHLFWLGFASDDDINDFLTIICQRSRESWVFRLLKDPSFIHHPRVIMWLPYCAFQSTQSIILKACKSVSDRLVEMLKMKDGSSDLRFLVKIADLLPPLSASEKETLTSSLFHALQIVKLARKTSFRCFTSEMAQIISLVCKVDFLFRTLLQVCGENRSELITAIFFVRLYLDDLLRLHGTKPEWIRERNEAPQLLMDFLESSVNLFRVGQDPLSLFSCTKPLMQYIFDNSMSTESQRTIAKIEVFFTPIITRHKDDEIALCILGRLLVDCMGHYAATHDVGIELSESFKKVADSLWLLWQSNSDSTTNESACLALALLIFGVSPSLDDLGIEKLFSAVAEKIPMGGQEAGDESTFLMMIGLTVRAKPTANLRRMIIDYVVERPQGNEVLDAALCKLAEELSAEELESLLHRILRHRHESSDGSIRFELVTLLVRYLREPFQTTIISKLAPVILSEALPRLVNPSVLPNVPNRISGLEGILRLISEIAHRSDIMVFREIHLATTLSHLSSFFGTLRSCSSSGIMPTTLYTLSTSILGTLFQRYSKLLYACVPSVISFYYALLSHAMYGPDNAGYYQSLASACELLVAHRDIYKKHIIGLLLEYLHGVSDLSVGRRERLLPAIYSLLDTLSTHELQQLNACMESKHRVLFRSLYQHYKKVHTYKGQ